MLKNLDSVSSDKTTRKGSEGLSASHSDTPIPVAVNVSDAVMGSLLSNQLRCDQLSQAILTEPKAKNVLVSPHFILEAEGFKPKALSPTGNTFADFMLGHSSVHYEEHGQKTNKFIDDFIDPKYLFSDLLLEPQLASLLFPTREDTHSKYRANTKTRALFYTNPILRDVQTSILDIILVTFGLERHDKSIIPCEKFHQNTTWSWLNNSIINGKKQRDLLLRIIKSLHALGNQELAINLCQEAKKQLKLKKIDSYDFDTAFDKPIRETREVKAKAPQGSQALILALKDTGFDLSSMPDLEKTLSTLSESEKQSLLARALKYRTQIAKTRLINTRVKQIEKRLDEKSGFIFPTTGVKTFVYKAENSNDETQYYSLKKQYLGKISPSDKLVQPIKGNYKKMCFKNHDSVLFTNEEKYSKEFILEANQNLSVLNHKDYPHLYPNFFIASDLMMGRNAGHINGKDLVLNEKKRLNIADFEGLVKDIENCYQKKIFLCDIKPQNLMIKQKEGKQLVNLIDIDAGVLNTNQEIPDNIRKKVMLSEGFSPPSLIQRILALSSSSKAEEAEYLMINNNAFCLLLTMYFMTTGQRPPNLKTNNKETQAAKDDIIAWLKKVVKAPYREKIIAFFNHPLIPIDINLSDCINWQITENTNQILSQYINDTRSQAQKSEQILKALQAHPYNISRFENTIKDIKTYSIHSQHIQEEFSFTAHLTQMQQQSLKEINQELKSLHSDLEQIKVHLAKRKIVKAVKNHISNKALKKPDELGNKSLIYTNSINNIHFHFHNNHYLGKINFKKDELKKEEQKEGQFKLLTHHNEKSVYFELNEKTCPPDISHFNKQNILNHYLDKYSHIIPAYFVKKEEKIGMLAKNAGEKDGRAWAREKRVPLSAFKNMLTEIENCNENKIFFFDIKPENTMVTSKKNKDKERVRVNLIDVDSTTAIIRPEDNIVECTPYYSIGYTNFGLEEKIANINQTMPLELVSEYLIKNNNYCLLKTMYAMNRNRKNIPVSTRPKNLGLVIKEQEKLWLKEVIKPDSLAMVSHFLDDPLSTPLFKISDVINWSQEDALKD